MKTFQPIPLLEPLVKIPDEILKDMSTDSRLAHRLVKSVVAGVMPDDLAAMKPGKLCHSRWLTTGMRCLLVYTSQHGLSRENTEVLRLLATWVTQVYLPMYFLLKVQHWIVHGASHVVTLFRLWRQQAPEVRVATERYLQSEAWWAHPEPLLVALLASPVEDDRVFGISQVKAIRSRSIGSSGELDPNMLGSTSVREYTVPTSVNLAASSLQDLINWNLELATEPVFSARLTVRMLEGLKDRPLAIPKYSLHTQSCERAVQLVANASKVVSGQEKRHALIKSQIKHRTKMPILRTKKQFLKQNNT